MTNCGLQIAAQRNRRIAIVHCSAFPASPLRTLAMRRLLWLVSGSKPACCQS